MQQETCLSSMIYKIAVYFFDLGLFTFYLELIGKTTTTTRSRNSSALDSSSPCWINRPRILPPRDQLNRILKGQPTSILQDQLLQTLQGPLVPKQKHLVAVQEVVSSQASQHFRDFNSQHRVPTVNLQQDIHGSTRIVVCNQTLLQTPHHGFKDRLVTHNHQRNPTD